MRAVTYHPIGDAHHCVFRLMALLGTIPEQGYKIDRLRIMDFYFLFPSLLKKMKRTQSLRTAMSKCQSSLFKDPFQILPSKKILFNQMSTVQFAAINHLLSKGVIEYGSFQTGIVRLNVKSDGFDLSLKFKKLSDHNELLELITNEFLLIDLFGPNGLKHRSGLLEFRYDTL